MQKVCKTCNQPIIEVKIPKEKECLKCGNKWYTKLERPMQCPFCKNVTWDRPKKEIRKIEDFTQEGETWRNTDIEMYLISSYGRLWNVYKRNIEYKPRIAEKYYTLYFELA